MDLSPVFVSMYNTSLQVMGYWTFALRYKTEITMRAFKY